MLGGRPGPAGAQRAALAPRGAPAPSPSPSPSPRRGPAPAAQKRPEKRAWPQLSTTSARADPGRGLGAPHLHVAVQGEVAPQPGTEALGPPPPPPPHRCPGTRRSPCSRGAGGEAEEGRGGEILIFRENRSGVGSGRGRLGIKEKSLSPLRGLPCLQTHKTPTLFSLPKPLMFRLMSHLFTTNKHLSDYSPTVCSFFDPSRGGER